MGCCWQCIYHVLLCLRDYTRRHCACIFCAMCSLFCLLRIRTWWHGARLCSAAFNAQRDVDVLQNEERGRQRQQLADMLSRLTAEQQKSAALQGAQSQLQTERRRNAELAAELAKHSQVANHAEQSQQTGASNDRDSVGTDVVHQLACLQGSTTALGRCSLSQLHR